MSKSNTFENDLLQLLFNNVDIADIGDAAGIQNSATAGSLYLALHTADPGEAGYILGHLLANIPDSVWDELKASHTTANSYRKIVQALETISKQIKAFLICLYLPRRADRGNRTLVISLEG